MVREKVREKAREKVREKILNKIRDKETRGRSITGLPERGTENDL